VRTLPLLLVAACSSSSSPQETCAEGSGPVTPVAPPAAIVEPAPAPRELAARCPLGDLVNVTIYRFLERELEEAAPQDGGRAETRALLAREAELAKRPDMKPLRASIVERETSHVLDTLCNGTPGCKAIGIYSRSGLAVALSSLDDVIAPLGFDEARWATLTAIGAEGATLALAAPEDEGLAADMHVLVAYPAEHGLAACIVEK
jgi:hypothetical protein